jgi:hypothetical protein
MSKQTEHYRQCHLTKASANGTLHKTTYLPECFAFVKSVVSLKNLDGSWSNGWTVQTAGDLKDARGVEANSRNKIKNEDGWIVEF